MKTTLYLIRHGQTEWNAAKRMQGRQDSPLTAVGVAAATELAPLMPAVDHIYSSPSGRAVNTAKLVFGEQAIHTEYRLQEIAMGEWEGQFQADLDIHYTEQHANFWKAPHQFNQEGAETFTDVAQRASAFIDELLERHPGETVAVVSHTTVIRSMLFAVEPRELSAFWEPPAVYPASISEMVFENGTGRVERFGCTAHHEHAHTGAY